VIDLTDLSVEERVVHSEFVSQLCVGDEKHHVSPHGLRIKGATVTGTLNLSYCSIPFPLGFAQSHFEDELLLGRLGIPGFELLYSKVPRVWAASSAVTYTLDFTGTTVAKEISLIGAKIGGDLICSGLTLGTASEKDDLGASVAMNLAKSNIGGDAVLDEDTNGYRPFVAHGEIRLAGAEVRGTLTCSGASLLPNRLEDAEGATQLHADGATALHADGSKFGDVYLERVTAQGELRFVGATVNRDFNCSGAQLRSDGDALTLDGAQIGGNVSLTDGFHVSGIIRAVGATIGGSVQCVDAHLINPGDVALALDATKVAMWLTLRGTEIVGAVHLFRATASALEDDLGEGEGLGSWSGSERLALEGFTYDRFGGKATWDFESRSRWLRKSDTFEPGAWHQLVTVYSAAGREEDARRAHIGREEDRRKRGGLGQLQRVGRLVLRAVIGHGYRPSKAALWAVPIVAAFAFVVWITPRAFLPEAGAPSRDPQPAIYALDTFLPIIDLGEADHWTPIGSVQWIEWVVIILGWILSTLVVAGFTHLVRA
jgi:hypothetical protein